MEASVSYAVIRPLTAYNLALNASASFLIFDSNSFKSTTNEAASAYIVLRSYRIYSKYNF